MELELKQVDCQNLYFTHLSQVVSTSYNINLGMTGLNRLLLVDLMQVEEIEKFVKLIEAGRR